MQRFGRSLSPLLVIAVVQNFVVVVAPSTTGNCLEPMAIAPHVCHSGKSSTSSCATIQSSCYEEIHALIRSHPRDILQHVPIIRHGTYHPQQVKPLVYPRPDSPRLLHRPHAEMTRTKGFVSAEVRSGGIDRSRCFYPGYAIEAAHVVST